MAAPSITATVDPAHAWVRLDVDCFEYLSSGDFADVTIMRYAGGSTVGVPVRLPTADAHLKLSNGRGTVYDTEAPLDVPLTYKATFRSWLGIVTANPSFETNVAGWTAYGGLGFAQSAVRAKTGTKSALLTVPAAVASDTFQRAVAAGGWGPADVGGAWTTTAVAAADYSVNGTVGLHSNGTVNATRRSQMGLGSTDQDQWVSVSTPVVATGATIKGAIVARYVDANTYYWGGCSFGTGGVLTAQIAKRSGGVESTLDSVVVPGGYVANTLYRVRFRVVGGELRLKVWAAANAEPADWTLEAVFDGGIAAGNVGGVMSRLSSGNTNAVPVAVSFDDYQAGRSPGRYVETGWAPVKPTDNDALGPYAESWVYYEGTAPLHMTAGFNFFDANGGYLRSYSRSPFTVTPNQWFNVYAVASPSEVPPTTAQASMTVNFDDPVPGTQVWLDNAGLIPDEENLDANAITVTSAAPVTLPSNGAFWLKDPLRPGLNIRVPMRFDNTNCAQPTGVVFVGLDGEKYSASSAAFDVDQSPQPVVLAGRRKDAESTLRVLAASFADRDKLLALLAPGSPLLFQCPAAYGIPDRYVSIGEVSVTRLVTDHRRQWRVFALPFVAVGPPAGPGQGVPGTRWKDLCARYATWADLTAAGLTWQQIEQGAAG